MKNTLLAGCIILISNFVFAQNPASQIEINPYLRWDSYPSFTTPYNSVMNSTIKMKGNNWGVGIYYKYAHKKRILIKGGIGYYKYSFDDIQSYTRLFGIQNSREIKYTGGSSTFGYATNKYWYNTLSATIGIEKLFNLKKNWLIFAGLDVINYYTFSQRYILFSTIKYKESDGHYFGISTNIYTGVQQKLGRINIGPTFILPVYANWKQDSVFPIEQNNKNRNKWLRGFGIGVSCTYSLTKKQ